MKYLRPIFFTALFAFTLNAATAQKKSEKIKTAQQAGAMSARETPSRESMDRYVYMVAMVTEIDGRISLEFMEGKNDLTRKMMYATEERQKKAMDAAGEVHTEVDLINLLNKMNLELISVVSQRDGRVMKYYLRQKLR